MWDFLTTSFKRFKRKPVVRLLECESPPKVTSSKALFSFSFPLSWLDEPEYRMDHARRGTAVIINNRRFDAKLDMPTREGSDKDAASLEFSFRKLGFDVRLAHNCTATFMRQELFKAARADHSTADCFVCVILSHGDEGTVYAVDKAVELDALIQPFKQNRTLAGKPKLFFVQACRGSSFMEGIDSNPYEINYVNKVSCPAPD